MRCRATVRRGERSTSCTPYNKRAQEASVETCATCCSLFGPNLFKRAPLPLLGGDILGMTFPSKQPQTRAVMPACKAAGYVLTGNPGLSSGRASAPAHGPNNQQWKPFPVTSTSWRHSIKLASAATDTSLRPSIGMPLLATSTSQLQRIAPTALALWHMVRRFINVRLSLGAAGSKSRVGGRRLPQRWWARPQSLP